MPNIITHGLFAKSVFEEIQDASIKEAITLHPREFIIGSNGPDFFFFYRFFHSEEADFRNIGSLVHASHTHQFYQKAFDILQAQEEGELKQAMLSYLAGHLCHWALDSRSHPYIFYKTGDCKGLSASMHHRFESMLDAMMLKIFRDESIKTFKFYLLAKQSDLSTKAISAFYVPIIFEVYGQMITPKQIQTALDDWYIIQTYLYDPSTVKTKLLKIYEKKVHHPYLYSGNVVPAKIDETFDVLNQKHAQWCYPTDDSKVSHESFLDIFNRAKTDAANILNVFHDPSHAIELIGNDSYDTGESEAKEMKYFDILYGDMQ